MGSSCNGIHHQCSVVLTMRRPTVVLDHQYGCVQPSTSASCSALLMQQAKSCAVSRIAVLSVSDGTNTVCLHYVRTTRSSAVSLQVVLDNGLRVFLLEDHEVPLVKATLLMRGGARASPPDKASTPLTAAALVCDTLRLALPLARTAQLNSAYPDL